MTFDTLRKKAWRARLATLNDARVGAMTSRNSRLSRRRVSRAEGGHDGGAVRAGAGQRQEGGGGRLAHPAAAAADDDRLAPGQLPERPVRFRRSGHAPTGRALKPAVSAWLRISSSARPMSE